MEILISIAAKVAGYAVAPIGRQLGYLFCYEQNVEDLNTKIEDLENVKERLRHEVEEAQRQGKFIEAGVNLWFTNVDTIITEHENFTRDDEQANTKCISAVMFPNLVLRHRLSRRAKEMAEKVATQIEAGNNFRQVYYRPNLQSSVGNKGYEGFESRNQTLTNVVEALRDPSVGMVGVWGMGGVGKTMLAKEVARRAKDVENLFTKVVFTTISMNQNIKKIQEEIGEKLGMSFSEENEDVRANRIRNQLAEENRILIIVDDIWDKLDLDAVGISFGINQKGCKIFFTSRSSHVLANNMGVNTIFPVESLPEHEATSLFRNIVGNQAERHDDDFQDLATSIVKECGGLPIAITTVASALKGQNCAVWKNALQELKKCNPVNIDGMHERVYTSIKFSYDYLRSVEAKHLLLLCSLFPEDAQIEIRVLCDYGFGLNLFAVVDTLEEARNKTDTLVTNLKNRSLLLDGDSDGWVKLHDVIRDVVIYIASNSSKLDDRMHNIRNARELENHVDKEMFKYSAAISLYDIEGDQYPQTLKSPDLKLLRLVYSPGGKVNSRKLPHQLFEELNKLLVLDLGRVSLKPLPAASFFCVFPKLQTLRLRSRYLGDIGCIGELKNLKILDLSDNDSITELPRGLGKLDRLLSLNLERCYNLKVIEPNVISSLTRLEELNIQHSFKNWEVQGVAHGDERRNANLSEVKNLRHLIDLNLEVPDINSVPKDMFGEQLKKYHIRIGSEWKDIEYSRNKSRILKLKLYPNSELKDFEALLKTSEALYIKGLKSVKSVEFEMESTGFQHLKHLTVKKSTEIRCIVNLNMDCRPAAFPSLESLVLRRLMNLENIIHGKLTTETSFGKLTEIHVSKCEKLKNLFLLFNIPRQLKRIIVDDCRMMEELITHHGREGDHIKKIEFSKLQSLWLSELPKLKHFIATRKSDEIKSEEQSIDDSVEVLFNGQVLFPELGNLCITLLNIQKIWSDDQLTTETSFGKLTEIEVSSCEKLKSLFLLFNIPRQLKRIEVYNCKMMEEIIAHHGREGDQVEKIEFSQLQSLRLSNLPKLVQFIATRKSEEIKSEKQSINDSVEAFFNGQVVFPKLEKLVIISLNIWKIWDDNQLSSSGTGFQNLTRIQVSDCDHLKGMMPSFMPASLVHLQLLSVESCEAMKEIVFIEESAQVMENYISFPQLQSLELSDLPNLERFCGGGISFSQLGSLKLQNIPNLERFCGGDISFPKLESLALVDLPNLERFCGGDISFPQLKSLKLDNLPNLERFCGGDCVDCSSLLKLKIRGCLKLRVFVTNNMPTTTTKKENENLSGSVDKHLSHRKDVMKVELSTESSSSEITCQPHLLASVEEHDDTDMVFKTKRLSDLRLWNFPYLQQLPKTIPRSVESLSICECGIRSKDLATPLMSFQNLKVLMVKDCHGLTSLLSPSTAKSLSQQLTHLGISGCKSLTQVIANDRKEADDDDHEIIFSQLEFLLLYDLSSLTSFYSGNNDVVLKFPHLDQLIVGDCPEMKTFYQGIIDCPSLHQIFLRKLDDDDDDDGYDDVTTIMWQPMILEGFFERFFEGGSFEHSYLKGDINTTIQKHWEYKNIRDSPESDGDSPESEENTEVDHEVDP